MDSEKIGQFENLVSENVKRMSGANNLIFNEKVKSLIKEGKQIAHFGFGESPFPVPDPFVRALRDNAHSRSYLPIQGTLELRRTLSEFHSHYDGVRLDPDNQIVGPGSKELIYLTINAFNGVVLLTSPTWLTYEQQCNLAGKVPVVLKTDKNKGWKLTTQTILTGLETLPPSHRRGYKLLILVNPGNPSGTCYTAEELQEVSLCCRENKILVVSDEIYARLTFDGNHQTMFYPEGTILVNGFSKWASAGGWRLGYAYFPPTLRSLFEAVCSSASNTYSCAPSPMQDAIAFLESVGVVGPKSGGGYYFMPDFEVVRNGLAKKGILTGDEMTKLMLEEAGVALMSNTEFLRPSNELSVRFCFVCFDGTQALKSYKALKDKGIKLDFLRRTRKKIPGGKLSEFSPRNAETQGMGSKV
ncbi:Aspartate aminotransferase [Armadillidium vulgare]|nr:Aspartate aminotransferase [Armadillidium vulgare]